MNNPNRDDFERMMQLAEFGARRHIGGYFDERVYQQWKFLAVEKGMTSQAMLEEAFDLWFQMNDKPAIAKK